MRPDLYLTDGGGYDESDTRMLRRAGLISSEEQAVRNALATVQADTGVEQALKIIQDAQGSSLSNATVSQTPTQTYVPIQIPFQEAPKIPTIVYATPPVPAPLSPITPVIKTVTVPVKTATPDIVLFDESLVPIETMIDLTFENIGGQELINIARSDTINGQKIKYQPIKNINNINQEYNPNNMLGLQKTSDKYFSGFAIKFENKIPNESNSGDGNPAYLDNSGNIIIDSINLNTDEQIEIQIALSGTIYEADI